MRKCCLKHIALLLFCLGFYAASAQDKRPKIGLVLSGGGAKGIAHIGVLKAMEKAGLTPDYITGTSMGSIVGGLYAAGYSADELEEIVEEADWSNLLTNKIPWNKVTYEEKFYYGRYLLEFYFANGKLVFPKGIIEGQALTEMFSNKTRAVHNITDFNELPIPFACVGADIVTGQPVVLNKGSLAMSMRASMAIPSIFTPVKINDHLLVDGGLVHNMPVQEALDMGADIIIGVFVSSDLDPEESLTSPLAIISQSAFLMSAFDAREQLERCDILIKPDLKDFSTGSFNMSTEILKKGDEAGEQYYEVFKTLADSLKQFGPLHKVERPALKESYQFDEITVEGNEVIKDDFILGKLRLKTDVPVSIDHIEERFSILYGTQYFEKLWYEILGEAGHQRLKVYVIERPKIQFRFSYHYDSENKGGVVGNITLRNFLLNRSRMIFEADLATFPNVFFDYFKYLGKKQNVAFRGNVLYSSNELPSYDSLGNTTSLFSSNYTRAGLGFQTTRKRSSTVGVAVNWSNMILKPKIADDLVRSISRIRYNSTSLGIFYEFNNLNERYFPKSGLNVTLNGKTTFKTNGEITLGDSLTLSAGELEGLIQTNQINSASLTVFPVIPLSSRLSFLLKGRLKLSNINSDVLNFDEFEYVGGFIPGLVNANEYYGLSSKELVLTNYFFSRLGLQYEVKHNLFLQGHFSYVNTKYPVEWIYKNADTEDLIGDRNYRYSYGGLLGMNTPVGPLAVAVAKDHFRKKWKASLIIGFYF